MINRLKAAIVSMDLDEFERALVALDSMDLANMSESALEECYEILRAGCEAIEHERSCTLRSMNQLKQISAYAN